MAGLALDHPICATCGSQFDPPEPERCKICDDPRQYVPASGQSWTTLRQIQTTHKNVFEQVLDHPNLWSFSTEPKFPIGERAFILQLPSGGCVMWDMIALVDQDTVQRIKELCGRGRLLAIVVSHPHYYTTYADWSRALGYDVPVVISSDDKEWLCRRPPSDKTIDFIDGPPGTVKTVAEGVSAVKTGGHFPGSLVLHWAQEKILFIADTIVTVPSAHTPHPRPPGQTSYVFQWSIPNTIPLPPDEILQIWRAIAPLEFETTLGAFKGMDVVDSKLKKRMLDSMQIQVRAEGWKEHALLDIVL